MYSLMFFFFNDTATTEIYTLSLHDALPISSACAATSPSGWRSARFRAARSPAASPPPSTSSAWRRSPIACPRNCPADSRSEEHTSELQSRQYLVCRLLLEKKQTNNEPVLYT